MKKMQRNHLAKTASSARPGRGAPVFVALLVCLLGLVLLGCSSSPSAPSPTATPAPPDAAAIRRHIATLTLQPVEQVIAASDRVDSGNAWEVMGAGVPGTGWLLDDAYTVRAQVAVRAGIDLSAVADSDIAVTQQGENFAVVVTIPAPRIAETVIVPNSIRITHHPSRAQRVFNRAKNTTLTAVCQLGDRPCFFMLVLLRDDSGGKTQVRTETDAHLLQQARMAATQRGLLAEAAVRLQAEVQQALQQTLGASGHTSVQVQVRSS
jgi:hypothetical protein